MKMLQATVSADIEQIDPTSEFMELASTTIDEASELLFTADEFLFECESHEEESNLQKVNKAKVRDITKSLKSYAECLDNSAKDIYETELQNRESFYQIAQARREQLKSLDAKRLELVGLMDSTDTDEVEQLYLSVYQKQEDWIEAGLRDLKITPAGTEAVHNASSKASGPELKLDSLTLPVFNGNMRNFAKFVRDFENTVCAQYSNPKVRLMYLQSQCLGGKAKDAVSNLVDYDEAMSRLRQRFGNQSVIIDTVLRDIRDIRMPTEEPNAIIVLSRKLETAWDDYISQQS